MSNASDKKRKLQKNTYLMEIFENNVYKKGQMVYMGTTPGVIMEFSRCKTRVKVKFKDRSIEWMDVFFITRDPDRQNYGQEH